MAAVKIARSNKQAYHKQNGEAAARKAAMESFALVYIQESEPWIPAAWGVKLWNMYKRAFPDRERLGRDRFEDIIHRHGLKVRKNMGKRTHACTSRSLPRCVSCEKETRSKVKENRPN